MPNQRDPSQSFLGFWAERTLIDRLRAVAKRLDVKPSQAGRNAVAEYVEKHEKEK